MSAPIVSRFRVGLKHTCRAALWRRQRVVVAISMLLCFVNVAFVFWGAFLVDSCVLLMVVMYVHRQVLSRYVKPQPPRHAKHWIKSRRHVLWQGPHSHWDSSASRCVETDGSRNRLNYLVGCIADLLNLILALGGIWAMKCDGKFWKLLYHQAGCPSVLQT